jgi:hypothetical protein
MWFISTFISVGTVVALQAISCRAVLVVVIIYFFCTMINHGAKVRQKKEVRNT